jgi:hypothetical protein
LPDEYWQFATPPWLAFYWQNLYAESGILVSAKIKKGTHCGFTRLLVGLNHEGLRTIHDNIK